MRDQKVAHRFQIGGAGNMRREGRVTTRGQSKVQLGGAAAEDRCCIQIQAGVLARFWRDRVRFGGGWSGGRLHRGGALVVTVELVQRPLPAVAFVLHEALEQHKGGGFVALATHLDGSAEGRSVGEAGGFREEAADFHVGILSGLLTPKQLQDEPIAEDGRGVALFRGARRAR